MNQNPQPRGATTKYTGSLLGSPRPVVEIEPPTSTTSKKQVTITATSDVHTKITSTGKPSLLAPDTIVTFVIDKTALEFMVHRSYAVAYSPFLRAAFNSKFVEGQTQIMTLEDVEMKTFGLFVHWLYFQKIESDSFIDILVLAKLWVLADRCLMPRLQNEVLRELVLWIRGPLLYHRSTIIYRFAVHDSSSRELNRLAIDTFGRIDKDPSVMRKFWGYFSTGYPSRYDDGFEATGSERK